MIKILKQEKVYRRDEELVGLQFWDCTKITIQESDWKWDENLLQHYCLSYVTSGEFEFKINRKHSVKLEANTILLLPPNTLVSAHELSNSGSLWMLSFICEDFLFFDMPKNHLCVSISSSVSSLFYQLNSSFVHENRSPFYYEAILILILEEIKRHIVTDPEKHLIYDKVCQYISNHIGEDLDVQKISDAMNYNRDYLCRIIHECDNSNIQQLIIEEKLNTAKNLLRMTTYSCEKIATYISINTGNNFVKFFKYHTGETPSQYRSKYNAKIFIL